MAAGAGAARSYGDIADQLEAVYGRLVSRRHDPDRQPRGTEADLAPETIDCDLHMHTDHSNDCATPVEVLLETAKDRGMGAIAVTDHNEISGALAAREAAERDGGIKVIVGEEVKTAEQGEVIGLFLEEKIERGMTMAETVAEIRRQGGLVYVPASVRPAALGARLRASARHGRGDRHPRGLQPARRLQRLQRGGGAFRGQVPDRPRGRAPTATSPRPSAACGSGCTTSTGRRSSSRRCATPTSSASTRTSSTCRR